MASAGLTDREHSLLVAIAKAQLALLDDAQGRIKAEYLRAPRDQGTLGRQVRTLASAEANIEYDLRMMGKL